MYLYFAIIAIIIALIIIVVIAVKSSDSGWTVSEGPQRIAGRRGEERAASIIKSVLREGDCLFTNVEISFEGKTAELDNVIVNKYGVFIIEVKNYVGYIVGNEEDYEWVKYKTTDAGNTYKKTVRNPIKQVKRQIYLLAKYFDYYGVKVWVDGYALLMHGNSPVESNLVLSDIVDIDNAIHTPGKVRLTPDSIESIKKLLQ